MRSDNADHVSQDLLTRWALSCLRLSGLGCTIYWGLAYNARQNARALNLARRVERRAWDLFTELIESGARKPENYQEPVKSTQRPVNLSNVPPELLRQADAVFTAMTANLELFELGGGYGLQFGCLPYYGR